MGKGRKVDIGSLSSLTRTTQADFSPFLLYHRSISSGFHSFTERAGETALFLPFHLLPRPPASAESDRAYHITTSVRPSAVRPHVRQCLRHRGMGGSRGENNTTLSLSPCLLFTHASFTFRLENNWNTHSVHSSACKSTEGTGARPL